MTAVAAAARSDRPRNRRGHTGTPGGLSARQRPTGIGAALRVGARIVLAHRGGQRLQPLIQCGAVGGPNVAGDKANPTWCRVDIQTAAVLNSGRHPHPGRIDLATHGSPVAQFGRGQLHPLLGVTGDRRIQLGDDRVVDVLGARDDRQTIRKSITPRTNTLATAGSRSHKVRP